MGFWGWRPLVIAVFVSVWVVGCNIVSDASPRTSPTPSPRVTLTLRRPATATASPSPRAVVRPTTPARTPEPPAAGPTPFTYTVADGDTLGDIALAFDVSVQALREANDNLDPRSLQPGQTLLIPIRGVSFRPPTATATPPELALADPACYETPAGALLCLGLVDNRLDVALEQVEVLVQVFDADAQLLRESEVDVEQALIRPQMSAPYRAYFDIDNDDVARVEATLRRADALADAEARFVRVDVEDVDVALEGGRTVVSATLHNRTGQDAEAVRVIITLKDDDGHVIGYRLSAATDFLPAGGSAPVRLAIVAQADVPTPDVDIEVEARPASAPDDTG